MNVFSTTPKVVIGDDDAYSIVMEQDALSGSYEEQWLEIRPGRIGDAGAGTLSERQANLWALVLAARALPSHVEMGIGGWRLLVPAGAYDEAAEQLRLFEEENRDWPPPPPAPRPLVENTLATLSVLILLATFFNVTQLGNLPDGHSAPNWTELGSARANLILDGEWWRLVTALTLHADLVHLIGNLTIGGFFLVCLCRELGSGLSWSLLLAAGASGNWLNAHVQLPSHDSVGASTAVFAAVGIFASISLVRYRHHLHRRWPLPVAAALALLVLLGTEGRNTDLGAHFFGFFFGIGFGLAAEFLIVRYGRPGQLVSVLLASASAAVVVLSWWAAFTLGVY
ncbi:rhomboid family intramembrane serine protease [Geobacter sp. DSM 9736]|uniref:rhomboid family intramembrane serine protease n=1 Tax=Geobacter sp. DSM 9736 TaxID=1277350 RepID=UPI000B613003|nr:rhomboid family intramembrane serine protease [Geobacter sp. DSM 9736]SNB45906.1 Membrane associated serine protease, rhomboid family [Geobacter sp. DSM 9736]